MFFIIKVNNYVIIFQKELSVLKKINLFFYIVFFFVIIYFLFTNNTKLEFVEKYEIENLPKICGDINLGGFSDLFYKDNYLYAITDRGPNSDDFIKDEKLYRTFPCQNYTTHLVQFELKDKKANIVKITPIKDLYGIPVSEEKDSIPVDKNGKNIPFNINGADVESFIIDKNGNYWFAEEYYPSIIKLDKNLNIVKRFAPKNCEIKNPKIIYNLPEQLNNIQKNLGFESMAYDGNENIFVFTQAGLKGEKDIIILKFNIQTEQVEEIFKYNFFEKCKLSATVFVEENKFFVAEKLYKKHFLNEISLKKEKYKRSAILRTLTSSDKITENIKIEGIAKNNDDIYIINDNDFGIDNENIKTTFINHYKIKEHKFLKKK